MDLEGVAHNGVFVRDDATVLAPATFDRKSFGH